MWSFMESMKNEKKLNKKSCAALPGTYLQQNRDRPQQSLLIHSVFN